jgi:hypothetical protein
MTEHTVDATAEEIGAELVAVEPPKPALAVTPQVSARELVDRLTVIREAMNTAMQRDVDYGVIPGTDKPTLYKPGSEKLSVLFQLDVQLANEKRWGPGDHLTVESHATVFHAPTGARLGYGEGIASTRERKHAYRKQERTCPNCGQPAVIKGKAAVRRRVAVLAEARRLRQQVAGRRPGDRVQEVGEVDNPDLPDLWNTVVKMAEKRARIDAVLAVTGASALFTQDLDDQAAPAPENASDASSGGSTGTAAPDPTRSRKPDMRPCTDAQWGRLEKERTKAGLGANDATINLLLAEVGAGDWAQRALSQSQASALIERFIKGTLPTGESDIPSDASEFERPADAGADEFFEPEAQS